MRWTRHFILILWLATCAATDTPKDYVGCFFDGASNKDLADVTKVGSTNTIETCIQLCKSKRYRFAGLQYSTECTCGNSYDEKWDKTAESDCNMPCAGNSLQICGAGLRNSIYRTGYLGCHVDRPEDRDIRDMTNLETGNNVENCIQLCTKRGFPFAALQGTFWCHCGSSYGKHGKAPESECNSVCPGNRLQVCGASGRNSIYKTGCSSRLSKGQRLLVGQSICSPDGMYSLYLNQRGYIMLSDKAANKEYYVITSPSVPRPSEVSFDASGVLVAISASGQTYWSTGASGEYLELQNNGMFQLFSRDSTTGQYVVSWAPGLLPLTTVVSDQKQFFIPGGYRKGLQLRASMKFNEFEGLNIAETLGSDNIAMHIATRFVNGQIVIDSLWNGVWQAPRLVNVGSSFVNGAVSEIVYSADESGIHAYSTRTPNVIYDSNPMNLPLEKFKYLTGSQPITVIQVTYDYIMPEATVTERSETILPHATILPSVEAITSTIPPAVAVCNQQSSVNRSSSATVVDRQQPSVVTVVLACCCCFEAVIIAGLFIYVFRRRRMTPTVASVTAEYRAWPAGVKEGGELLWDNRTPSHNSSSTPLAVY